MPRKVASKERSAESACATGAERGGTSNSQTVPVLREKLIVGKRTVESGRVVVKKTIRETEETVDLPLERTDVHVERVPVGRVVHERPKVREEGDVVIVPIVEEVLVVEKRLMLKEELRIRKSTQPYHQPQTHRLKEEHIEIERLGEESHRDVGQAARGLRNGSTPGERARAADNEQA